MNEINNAKSLQIKKENLQEDEFGDLIEPDENEKIVSQEIEKENTSVSLDKERMDKVESTSKNHNKGLPPGWSIDPVPSAMSIQSEKGRRDKSKNAGETEKAKPRVKKVEAERSKQVGTIQAKEVEPKRSQQVGTIQAKEVEAKRSKQVGTIQAKEVEAKRSKQVGTIQAMEVEAERSKKVGTIQAKEVEAKRPKKVGTIQAWNQRMAQSNTKKLGLLGRKKGPSVMLGPIEKRTRTPRRTAAVAKKTTIPAIAKKSKVPAGGQSTMDVTDRILGMTRGTGELTYLVKWKGSENADLVSSKVANALIPQVVIRFYEQHFQDETTIQD